MSKPYTVAVVATDLPTPVRINAECRYAAALERRLGGDAQVAAVYRAWMDATQSDSSMLNKETADLAIQWPRAAKAAEDAGMQGLGHFEDGAHFEVRVERRAQEA